MSVTQSMLDRLKQSKQRLLDPESGNPSDDALTLVYLRDQMSAFFPNLSYQERLIGCLTCFLLGFLLSLGSTFRLTQALRGKPGPFATAYTIGNVLSLTSSCFFAGPWNQVKSMFHQKRRISTIAYIFLIGLTLTLCFSPNIPHRKPLVILSVLAQFMALIWYTLSYIPYGRNIALACLKRGCRCSNNEELKK